jgi:hypothetical protein
MHWAPWSETTDDVGVGRQDLEEPADLGVDVLIVFDDHILERVPRLVAMVFRVHVLPEGVVDAVGPHLDHHERSPRGRPPGGAGPGEPLRGHPVEGVADSWTCPGSGSR